MQFGRSQVRRTIRRCSGPSTSAIRNHRLTNPSKFMSTIPTVSYFPPNQQHQYQTQFTPQYSFNQPTQHNFNQPTQHTFNQPPQQNPNQRFPSQPILFQPRQIRQRFHTKKQVFGKPSIAFGPGKGQKFQQRTLCKNQTIEIIFKIMVKSQMLYLKNYFITKIQKKQNPTILKILNNDISYQEIENPF